MYDFHYNFIKQNFVAELLFTDTDSIACEIKSEKVYEKKMLSTNVCLTLVTIQKLQSFLTRQRKKVIGKMKDDFGGFIVEEFVGLKSKMYSIKRIDGKELQTAKGVNIAEFNEFKDVLYGKKIIRHKM